MAVLKKLVLVENKIFKISTEIYYNKVGSYKTYVRLGDIVVKDNNSHLMWQRDISTSLMTWDSAKVYCKRLEYGGYRDWKLPTQDQLLTLIKEKGVDGFRWQGGLWNYTDHGSSYFWSSTEERTAFLDTSIGIVFSNKVFVLNNFRRNRFMNVRCVR